MVGRFSPRLCWTVPSNHTRRASLPPHRLRWTATGVLTRGLISKGLGREFDPMVMGQRQVQNQPATMVVTVGGRQYEIAGLLLGGQVPAWMFIKQDGQPMTHKLFDALPDADKRTLAEYVQRRINKQ